MLKHFPLFSSLPFLAMIGFMGVALTLGQPNFAAISCGLLAVVAVLSLVWHLSGHMPVGLPCKSVVYALLAVSMFAFLPLLWSLLFQGGLEEPAGLSRTFSRRLLFILAPFSFALLSAHMPARHVLCRCVVIGVLVQAVVVVVSAFWSFLFDFGPDTPHSFFNLVQCLSAQFPLMHSHRTSFALNSCAALICLFLLFRQKRLSVLPLGGVVFLLLAIVYLSGARIGLLCCLFVMAFMVLDAVYLRLSNRRNFWWLVAACCAVCLFVICCQGRVAAMLSHFFSDPSSWLRLDPRFGLWHAALSMVPGLPFFGYGADGYGQPFFNALLSLHREAFFSPHNLFLHTLLSLGPVGLALLILGAAYVWHVCNSRYARLWLVVVFVNSMFECLVTRNDQSITLAISLPFCLLLCNQADSGADPAQRSRLWRPFAALVVGACLVGNSLALINKPKEKMYASFNPNLVRVSSLPAPLPSGFSASSARVVDSTTFAWRYYGKLYFYTRLDRLSVSAADSVATSLWMWVSPDFDGCLAFFAVGNDVGFASVCEYDLQRKGEWQRLSVGARVGRGLAESTIQVHFADPRLSGPEAYRYLDLCSLERMHGRVLFSDPVTSIVHLDPSPAPQPEATKN